MPNSKFGNPANVITLAILAMAMAIATHNIATALLTDSIWILTGSGAFSRGFGTTPTQIYRSEDPVTFYVTLILAPAFSIFLSVDLWRKYQRYKKSR